MIGRIYHVVNKTTNKVVKVGSTLRTLSHRWEGYDHERYCNHFLKQIKTIESNAFDWYERGNAYCPFLWHLVAAEHMEMLRVGTFQTDIFSNKISPLDQKFSGLTSIGSSIGGTIGGKSAKKNKTGIFVPGYDTKKGGKAGGPISGKLAATRGQVQQLGRVQGRLNVESGHLDKIRSMVSTEERIEIGRRNFEKYGNPATPESLSKAGRHGRLRMAALGRSGIGQKRVHELHPDLGRRVGRWAVESGQLASLRTPEHQKAANKHANHVRWHVSRNIVNPECPLCRSVSLEKEKSYGT